MRSQMTSSSVRTAGIPPKTPMKPPRTVVSQYLTLPPNPSTRNPW